MNELGDGKVEEEMERSKKEGKEETKSEPPGPPPIGLIELVRLALSFPFDKKTSAVQVFHSPRCLPDHLRPWHGARLWFLHANPLHSLW